MHTEQNRIPVAVRVSFDDLQSVSGTLPFGPKLLASAAVERHETCSERGVESLLVHKTDHKQFPTGGILHDCGSQSLHFVEIDFYVHPSLLFARSSISPKSKNPLGEVASGLGFPLRSLSVIRGSPPTRASHGDDGADDDGDGSTWSRFA
jgi:hypothetical protein